MDVYGAALPRFMGMGLTWIGMDEYGWGVVLNHGLQDYDDALHRSMDSRFRGNDWPRVGMTAAQPLPLWIADQARNDVAGNLSSIC